MNLKKVLLIAAIVIAVGYAFICMKNSQQVEIKGNKVNLNLTEATNLVTSQELEIVSSEKLDGKHEVVVKNTSGKKIEKVEFTLGQITYELYDMLPDENYKFIAHNTEDNLNLQIISVSYDLVNFEEITLAHLSTNGKVVEGAIKNNTEMYISPSQIIYFLKDENGNTVQKTIHYESELNEDNIISSGNIFGFYDEIPEELQFNNEKKIVLNYLDVGTKEIRTILYEQ